MSGRQYILAETNWKNVKETDFQLAILPWGATEAHNYHLPYSTDNIQCDEITAEAARLSWEKGIKSIVLPTIPFGVNTGQLDIKFDINMNPSTQLAVLDDIVSALERQGIDRLLIVNGHGGNDFRQIIRELLPKYEIFICCLNWFSIVDESIFERGGDHANELETSVMQYLKPEFVLPLDEAGDGSEHRFKISGLREGWVWTQRHWLSATNDTGIGDPALASPEKGEKCVHQVAQKISQFLIDLADADLSDLYE